MSAKPYEPTPTRLARARRDGDHPLSHDFVAVAAFLGALAALAAVLAFSTRSAEEAIRQAASGANPVAASGLALPVVAIAIGGAAGAVAATALQMHGLSFRSLHMRFAFAGNFSREAAFAALRGAGAIVAAAIALLFSLRPGYAAIAIALGVTVTIGITSALIDLGITRAAWRRRLRMTHDELRRDARENDGDPRTRTRRRRLHRTLLRGSLREVRRASFIVANPTHVAVALRYAPPQTPVPTILVRALDEAALRVKSLAREANVPLIEDRELARRLYAHGTLGAIPRELYLAIAQIVAALQRSGSAT